MKLLNTIRLDASDEAVFDRAAAPSEIAVSGAFAFADLPRDALTGRTRQAFANGFLGLASFGRATVVAVAEGTEAEYASARDALARHFVEDWGAPDLEAAMRAAEAELAFAAELAAGLPVNTLLTVQRRHDDEGQLREAFRVVSPSREGGHARIWEVVEE